MEVMYPAVTVELTGQDGNAFAIIGKTVDAMRRAGVPREVINAYRLEATSGSYDNVLQTTMRYVEVE